MLSRSQKESYTILTPVETKDNMGNPVKIAGWIGESHVKEPQSADNLHSITDKVVTPKKKEKAAVDKSVFKVYDFESSEDEPSDAKRGLTSRSASQPNDTFSSKLLSKQGQARNPGTSVGKYCYSFRLTFTFT